MTKREGESSQSSSKNLLQLDRKVPINLILSGGGVKGVAHVALLELLEENGININAISGSSAGALVGALYASGKEPAEILSFFKTTPIFKYSWLNPAKPGLFDSSKYTKIISGYVGRDFQDLRFPLHIAATDIERGSATYFNEGNLIAPLLASCSVPAVFSPVLINDCLYADGGVTDNFPVRPFIGDGEHPLVGSYLCLPSLKKKQELSSILKMTARSNSLLLHSANEYKFSMVDNTIFFPLGEFGTFDTKKIDEIYNKSIEYLQLKLG